jgi:tetratricopeptide (TPR) repeat protein
MRLLVAVFLAILIAPIPIAAAQATSAPAPQSQPAAGGNINLQNLNDPDLTLFAQRLRAANRIVDARSAVKVLLSRNERNLEALVLDGELALELTPPDMESAKNSFQAVLRVQENDFRGNFGMGRIRYQQGSWRNALFYLQKAAPAAPADKVAAVQARLAQCYNMSGEMKAAFEAAEKALAAGPTDLEPHEVFVALLLKTRNYDRALSEADTLIDLCKQAIPTAAAKRDALIKLASAYNIRLGVLQHLGEGNFAVGPDGNPTDRVLPGRDKIAARLTRQVAETYVQVADLNRALTLFTTLEFAQRATTIDPTDVDAWLLVGMLQRNTSQVDAAVATFQKVLELDPKNVRARDELRALGTPDAPAAPASQPTTAVANTIP